ncbi:MAG: type II toxin-antitoxin system VapC family toxin [Gemmatimonadetes bacterium]|nr:type II toxin-antitoxin system VapC family toxin [Gemmatimonadota bacterium]
MPLFFDTSALGKLYVEEPGSERMDELVSRPGSLGGFFISDCVAVEVYGLFAKRLRIAEEERRKQKGGKAVERENRARYQTASLEFRHDYEGGRFSRVDIGREILQSAARFAQAFPGRRVSPMDLIHLATVFYLTEQLQEAGSNHNVVLAVCDQPLLMLADRHGVPTWNPEADDLSDLRAPGLFP